MPASIKLLKEKISIIARKGPRHAFRRTIGICIPKRKTLEAFFTGTGEEGRLPETRMKERDDPFKIEALTSEHRKYFDHYVAFRSDISMTEKRLENYLSHGAVVFLIFDNNKIIGTTSLDFRRHALEGGFKLDLVFMKNHAYCFLTYVHPQYRRRGLATFLRNHLIKYCRSNGYDGYFSLVYDWNTPNLSLRRKSGDLHYGRITMTEQFFKKRYQFQSFTNDRFLMIQFKNGKSLSM